MNAAPLQRLIDLALKEEVPVPELFALAEAASCTPNELLDQLSLHVARDFIDDALSFEHGDYIMNSVFGTLCSSPYPGGYFEMPDLTYEVYLAFDSGEYRRTEDTPDVDPVEKYTRPMLLRLLKEHPLPGRDRPQ
jgi:hypothetical protein